MPAGSTVDITTFLVKDVEDQDRYGRYVADITLADGSDLGERLIAGGFAAPGAFKG